MGENLLMGEVLVSGLMSLVRGGFFSGSWLCYKDPLFQMVIPYSLSSRILVLLTLIILFAHS